MKRICRNCKEFVPKKKLTEEGRNWCDENAVGLCYEGGIFGVTPPTWTQTVYNADKVLTQRDCCAWKKKPVPDQDTLQLKDETNKEWVKKWRKTVRKKPT